MRREQLRWNILTALLVAAMAVIYIKIKPMLEPTLAATAPVPPLCDLSQTACTSRLDGYGSVALSIAPKPIPVIKPLTLQVETQLESVASVAVTFTGRTMNMGVNRFILKQQGDNLYLGEGMLPICVRDRMAWQAEVVIETEGKLIAFPFHFDTVK